MPLHPSLTADRAADALASLGVRVAPGDVVLEPREDRWVARIPGGRMAWFAASAAGVSRMTTERGVLRVLEARCRFAAPRLLAEATDGSVDVRAMVPGVHDPFAVFRRVSDEPEAAKGVGAALGGILAELHSRVPASDVAGWLPRRPAWPEPRAWLRERLPRVVDDPALHADADAVVARYEEACAAAEESDRVLAHTDLGLHNAVVDPVTLSVRGVFDWESACWADRHHDFRYLPLVPGGDAMLDAALVAYETATGHRVSRARIDLYNAACAVGYLAYRDGVPPERRWCGRTLEEDLRWTRWAVGRALEGAGERTGRGG